MIACRICIAQRGLNGSEMAALPRTEDELVEHLERVHHFIVTRPGESAAAARARCDAAYPERANCRECQEHAS